MILLNVNMVVMTGSLNLLVGVLSTNSPDLSYIHAS